MEEKEKARRKRINKVKSFAGRRKRRRRRSHAKKINKIFYRKEKKEKARGGGLEAQNVRVRVCALAAVQGGRGCGLERDRR